MNEKFIITTESTADLTEEYYLEHNVPVIPLYYNVNGVVYGEERQLSVNEFYKKMEAGAEVSTASSNPAYLNTVFSKYAAEGFSIVHISFSSELSSSCSNAMMVAREVQELYPDIKIRVIDSLCASGGQGLLLYYSIKMKEEGHSMDEIVSWCEDNRLSICHEFTVDSLAYLQKGGRISKSVAVLGTIINVKPVLHMDNEGRLVSLRNVRGRKKSLIAMVDNMAEHIGNNKNEMVIITHANAEEDAFFVGNLVKEKLGITKFMFSFVSPTIGAHSGPGTVALFYMGDER